MPGIIILFIFVVIVLVVFSIVYAIRQEKKRREALGAFAESNGFTYAEKVDSPDDVGLPDIELFGRGRRRRWTNVMAGEVQGTAVRVLDYRYTTGSGKNSSTTQQTVVAVEAGGAGGAGLPNFTLAREHFFHKIGQAFGYQDIDFDEFPEFSKKYLLRGADEAAIRGLFNARLIDAYVSGEANNAEVRDGWLFIYQQGRRVKPELIQKRIESAFSLLFELTGA